MAYKHSKRMAKRLEKDDRTEEEIEEGDEGTQTPKEAKKGEKARKKEDKALEKNYGNDIPIGEVMGKDDKYTDALGAEEGVPEDTPEKEGVAAFGRYEETKEDGTKVGEWGAGRGDPVALAARKAIAAEDGAPEESAGGPDGDTWSGDGGFTYAMSGGEIEVTDAGGRTTYAKPGTDAFTAILEERHGMEPQFPAEEAPAPVEAPAEAPAPVEAPMPAPAPVEAPAPEMSPGQSAGRARASELGFATPAEWEEPAPAPAPAPAPSPMMAEEQSAGEVSPVMEQEVQAGYESAPPPAPDMGESPALPTDEPAPDHSRAATTMAKTAALETVTKALMNSGIDPNSVQELLTALGVQVLEG